IVNIVKNAVESFEKTDESRKPVITIELSRRDGVCLEISNNGEPIAPEVAPHLFSPFFTTKPTGKGLGLTLTGEILSNHKAVWRLQTDADGITHFAIRFRD
ncbi:MAG: GHKL domain-containing protein, partial [Muribaculaceae bacterium]|nr:GHKL domain-containing protein [Muribaculaceae bacterium]